MNEVVDRILNRCALVRTLDEARVAESREKISRYIEKAGRRWGKKIPIN